MIEKLTHTAEGNLVSEDPFLRVGAKFLRLDDFNKTVYINKSCVERTLRRRQNIPGTERVYITTIDPAADPNARASIHTFMSNLTPA